jgi:dipeptidyl aminopeptidase/acylaminoacyl peptidase
MRSVRSLACCECPDTLGRRWGRKLADDDASIVKTNLMRDLVIALVAAIAGLYCTGSTAQAEEADGRRTFNIKDSIEFSNVLNPGRSVSTWGDEHGAPIYSPDNRYFLLVTQRGKLSINALEGTIWLFERQSIWDYASGRSTKKVVPKQLVIVRATSNTPVIQDVRWIDGSKKIAFLGKNGSPYQRLFIVDVMSASVEGVSKEDLYATAYDIRGNTIVYSALVEQRVPTRLETQLVSVGGESALGLFRQNLPSTRDIDDVYLSQCPSSLHVRRNGKEMANDFDFNGNPLQLFSPNLVLSPDEKSLITVAPMSKVPKAWEDYVPLVEEFRLKAGATNGVAAIGARLESHLKPEQYVIANLETGSVSPLVDAPAGRTLGYGHIPTDVFWFEDSRHALLTNTYLPIWDSTEPEITARRLQHPAVTIVDVSTGEVQANVPLQDTSSAKQLYHIKAISWDGIQRMLVLRYEGEGAADIAVPAQEVYLLRSDNWIRIQKVDLHSSTAPETGVYLSICQDLNHPPMLCARVNGGKTQTIIWNPNPQLENMDLGKASVYRWQDNNGRAWSGVLLVPPGYNRGHKYPLVIQTHGYEAEKFFVDGYATTGSGGRALAARGFVILQADISLTNVSSPQEAPDQIAGFEAAINHLVAEGFVVRGRVGIIGFSRTCFHVLYALTHRPELFRAASITDGVNFGYSEYMLRNSTQNLWYPREAEGINGGTPFGDTLLNWLRDSPNFNLDKVQAPILISAFEQGSLLSEWETYSGLRKLGKPAAMLWWSKENTPHQLVQPAQRYASQQSAVDWFDFWLNDHEDLDSAKADQYARWRELRKMRQESPP